MDFSFDVPIRRPALLSRKTFDPMDVRGLIESTYERRNLITNFFFIFTVGSVLGDCPSGIQPVMLTVGRMQT